MDDSVEMLTRWVEWVGPIVADYELFCESETTDEELFQNILERLDTCIDGMERDLDEEIMFKLRPIVADITNALSIPDGNAFYSGLLKLEKTLVSFLKSAKGETSDVSKSLLKWTKYYGGISGDVVAFVEGGYEDTELLKGVLDKLDTCFNGMETDLDEELLCELRPSINRVKDAISNQTDDFLYGILELGKMMQSFCEFLNDSDD